MKKNLTLIIFPLLVLSALFLFMPSGKSITHEEQISTHYLEGMGFKALEYDGKVQSYILQKELLSELPYMTSWGVMDIDPSLYLGKNIEVHRLVVSNHPLDNYEDSIGRTNAFVYICESAVIGATSFPITKERLFGSVYSIDGRTLEEITQQDFQEWREKWVTEVSKLSTSLRLIPLS